MNDFWYQSEDLKITDTNDDQKPNLKLIEVKMFAKTFNKNQLNKCID